MQEHAPITFLKGYSGCKLILFERDGSLIVRKISKSKEYNKRLEEQAKKQEEFLKVVKSSKFTAPRIICQGNESGLYYFDMEYVHGCGLADRIAGLDVGGISQLGKDLRDIVFEMKEICKKANVGFWNATSSKLERLFEIVKKKPRVSKYARLISDLKSISDKRELEGEIEHETFCHGDLTLENIIYDKQNDRYCLIDFLDSYYSHYCFDIAKLFQDFEGRWIEHRRGDIDWKNARTKMNFLKQKLLLYFLEKDEFCQRNYYFLLAFTFARILPYAVEGDEEYIANRIRLYLNKAKKEVRPL